jgi:hypothetical protein
MSELNQEEREDIKQENITEEKPPESTSVSSNSEDLKYQSLKQEFNQSLNGVVLKLEKKFQSELQTILEEMKKPKEENKVTLETDKQESKIEDSVGDNKLTIQTLKAEYEAKTKELEEKFAASEVERLRDKKNTFLANVKSQVVRRFARLGFDDIESATDVFYSMHSEDNFIQGDGGTILYKIAEDQYSSLDMLTEEWKKGKIGKRFLKVNQPKGASLDEPSKQAKPSSTDKSKKRLTLRQIDEGINNGSIKVKY